MRRAVEAGVVALVLLIGSAAAAMAQPRDGIWEGGSSSFRIRFFVRGNGTSIAMNRLDALRFSCPGSREISMFRSYSEGFSAGIGGSKFAFLDRMTTPQRAAAGAANALVVQGTFSDSLHAEGRINAWIAMLSGQGVKSVSCPSRATTWEASWVGDEPPQAAAGGDARPDELTIGGLLASALAALDGAATIESAQTIYLLRPGESAPTESSILLLLELDETREPDAAAESPPSR